VYNYVKNEAKAKSKMEHARAKNTLSNATLKFEEISRRNVRRLKVN